MPAIVKKKEWQLLAIGFSIFWFLISMMRFKFPHYFIPGIPLAILISIALTPESISQYFRFLEKPIWALAVIVPMALLILPVKTAPEAFPAIRFFTPIIQSEGSKGDLVLYIENEQAYGGAGDYFVETAFYADRKFYSAQCAEAPAKITKFNPSWIITSGAEPFTCLAAEKANFPSIWKLGNQYLLGKTPRKTPEIFDLTPELRQLTAPIDGQTSPLPKDIYYRY